jgi:hypothetical protein
MNKAQKIEKKLVNSVIKRNHAAFKNSKIAASINAFDDSAFESKLALCKTQASVIHVCFETHKSVEYTINALVAMRLCNDEKSALLRIKRHVNHDKATRIIKRALALR